MTNLGRMRQMDAHEMARLLNEARCEHCGYRAEDCRRPRCLEGFEVWLKAEAAGWPKALPTPSRMQGTRNRNRARKGGKKRWADEKMDELQQKGKENWNQDDWESFNYIENSMAEQDYLDSVEP